ncbi:helix-turn-helix domain-containing protein [Nonomuraea sp. NPDC049637]|uniref:GlxA family transcriptional regulator n=1 Tax=Nonomuraea sp. NPDC049637 TaxID=3154356 RepID=UPI00342ECBED
MSIAGGMMFRSVVAFAANGVSSYGVSAVSGIFADRSYLGLPAFSFTVCAEAGGRLRTDLGLCMQVEHGPEAMDRADLVIVLPAGSGTMKLGEPVSRALVAAYRRGAVVAAYCSGTILLAGTGLLDGRRATTNWRLTGLLADGYPKVTVDPDVLYVDEGRVVTGAGVAAGVDMCLHLLRREYGTAVSNAVARESMVAPRGERGQVRYVPAPSGDAGHAGHGDAGGDGRLAEVLAMTPDRLRDVLTVDDLARNALMSPRTFARRFREATGTTPHAWLTDQRLDRAEELLETTALPILEIARLVGFSSDAVLRDHFVRRHGISPRRYRRTFRERAEAVRARQTSGRPGPFPEPVSSPDPSRSRQSRTTCRNRLRPTACTPSPGR